MRPDTFRTIQMPVVEPVSLTDVKQQIGILSDVTEFDRFLMDKVSTGRALVEARLGITMVATKYRAVWKVASGAVRLPAPPLLVSQAYPLVATLDGVALVASTDYTLDTDAIPGELTLAGHLRGKLSVEYWGGVPPETPPDPMLKSAILAYANHAFENRGILATDTAAELPQAFETLLAASSWNGGW
ncbi:MAG: hypothetical protein RLZZ21_282 [Planctomycetota bacterium]